MTFLADPGCSKLRPMRVLVVEDEKKTASFVRKALQGEGFAVDVCHNGNDACRTRAALNRSPTTPEFACRRSVIYNLPP
jgi:CheY-like chemotaxis protein